MKLYTRRGDEGRTDLLGGGRIDKDAGRMAAIGDVDELNAAVGWTAAACEDRSTLSLFRDIQGRLFELGADLAAPQTSGTEGSAAAGQATVPRLTADHVLEMEQRIDESCRDLPPMKWFILPGGTELAARSHLARAVCRRAERACVALSRDQPVNAHLTIYLNRLSDLLFALARRANHVAGVEDVPWRAPDNSR